MSKNLHILIVDDSKTFNNMVKGFFEELNYIIFQAFSIEEAKQVLQQESIDYVFLDLNLPDGSGEDMIEDIHERYKAKIIVMTGSTDTYQRDKLFEMGIVDYLIKTTPIPVITKCADTIIKNIEKHKNTNILTIDDSNFVRNVLKNILRSKDYNVFEASDVIDGKRIIENNDIHLILLDLIMPGIDGMSFLETLKSDKNYYDIPVIVISGDESRENYSRVLKQGASDFIKKPFVIEEVLLKCDIHVKARIHYKHMLEKEQKIAKQETMIALQKKEIEKHKSIASLIKNIAHQWRQPLSMISSTASSVKIDIIHNEEIPNDIIPRMDSVVEYTQFLSKTIDDFDMLTIKDPVKKGISTIELVDESIDYCLDFINKQDIKVIKDIDDMTFITYRDEIIKILVNIFKNIKEHAQNTKHIFIAIKNNGKKLIISIKDDGGGVEADILEQAFEPYFTTSHQSIGKGMGLYMIYRLIKEHFHGNISLKNQEYTYNETKLKGLEVYMELPL